jgi:hypothetical protein
MQLVAIGIKLQMVIVFFQFFLVETIKIHFTNSEKIILDDLTKFHMINCKLFSILVSLLAKLTKTMNPVTLVDQLQMQDVIQRQESTCYSA